MSDNLESTPFIQYQESKTRLVYVVPMGTAYKGTKLRDLNVRLTVVDAVIRSWDRDSVFPCHLRVTDDEREYLAFERKESGYRSLPARRWIWGVEGQTSALVTRRVAERSVRRMKAMGHNGVFAVQVIPDAAR